jgi:hypothetical protein
VISTKSFWRMFRFCKISMPMKETSLLMQSRNNGIMLATT